MFIFIAVVVLAFYVLFGLGMLGMMKAASLSDEADEAMQAQRMKQNRRDNTRTRHHRGLTRKHGA